MGLLHVLEPVFGPDRDPPAFAGGPREMVVNVNWDTKSARSRG